MSAAPHTECKVDRIPDCDICHARGKGEYDAPVNVGRVVWAHTCERCWQTHGVYTTLGQGKGQRWVLR